MGCTIQDMIDQLLPVYNCACGCSGRVDDSVKEIVGKIIVWIKDIQRDQKSPCDLAAAIRGGGLD